MTEMSLRVSPGGSAMHDGSLDSLAKVKLDSAHPVIAHDETHNAAMNRRRNMGHSSVSIAGNSELVLIGSARVRLAGRDAF